jgi:hypothetical protein
MKKVICLLAFAVAVLAQSNLLNAGPCPGTGRCVREIGEKEYVCKKSDYHPNCG